jgi:phage anti-repressor protein
MNVIDCETFKSKKTYVKKIKELYPEKLAVKTNDYMRYDFHKIIEKENNTYSLLFDQSRAIVMSNSIYYSKSEYNYSKHSTFLKHILNTTAVVLGDYLRSLH